MRRKWESMFKIISLLPTQPGWKAINTWSDGGTYLHKEVPIVGFAAVRRFSRREGDVAWRQEEDDQVEPLLFEPEFNAALPINDYLKFCDNRITTVVLPGESFDENEAINNLKARTA